MAIIHNGKLVYSRGFGYADIAQEKGAHAGTIYRLASVSKSVTRALTLRLVDLGQLSLEDATRDHVPVLPSFHTHTVRDLLKRRSGIRHYNSPGHYQDCNLAVPDMSDWENESSTQYATATEATELFRNDPLLFEPGSQECYSTHAYTVLGAALEGATDQSYEQILTRELTQGLGLSTLKPENRSQRNSNRATVYQTKSNVNIANRPATPQNISWKHAGGGLEASSVDIARYGQAILDDTFLTPESRAETSFSHSGAQQGAESRLHLNEREDLVIAVLSNQHIRIEGSSPKKLAEDIEEIILENQ